MKNRFDENVWKRVLLAIGILTILSVEGFAQFPEDALRFATPGLGVGARAIAMGGAYTGVANDYSALFWNPAGLAQLENSEFSIGLSHLNFKDNGSYFATSNLYSNNSTTLNALGLVFPVPVRRGSLVFAFGYNRESNFTTGLSYSMLSARSIAQDFAPDGELAPRDNQGKLLYNTAFELYLADTSNGGRWFSPIKGGLTQSEKTLEGGGINNWSVGAGIDLARNISAGVTLTYRSGSYKFDRTYSERDVNNIYHSTIETDPRNFDNLSIDDVVESDLTGFNAKLGLMFREPDRYRVGIAVKTPTVYTVKERFGTSYTNTPDFGQVVNLPADDQSGQYDVATPWVFSGGASLILNDLVLSGDVEYTDWSQLEFRDANADVLALNKKIKDTFRGTANVRGGIEYNIRNVGVRVRGGFIYNTSPYQGDPSSFDQKYVTGGLGILLSESTMLDLTYAHGWWQTFRNDYRGLANIFEKINTNNFNLTFTYRY
jgi:long-subunit fatty acid transport protein